MGTVSTAEILDRCRSLPTFDPDRLCQEIDEAVDSKLEVRTVPIDA